MDKLKNTIEQYGRWAELSIYIGRIETHIESDFSHSLENAKALLETIGKEICQSKGIQLSETSSINGVLKNAFSSLGYTNSNLVNQIASALATIGQQVGELRNEIGISSHDGKTEYKKGKIVKCDKWNDDWKEECAGGIHFFITRIEAENYN